MDPNGKTVIRSCSRLFLEPYFLTRSLRCAWTDFLAAEGELSSPETINVLCPFGNPLFDFAVPKLTPRHPPESIAAKSESASLSSRSNSKNDKQDGQDDDGFVNDEAKSLDLLPLTEIHVYDKNKNKPRRDDVSVLVNL